MTHRLLTVTVLGLGLLGVWREPATAQLQGQTIKIGIGAPLTGGAASFGVEMGAFDDEASDAKGRAAAALLCEDPQVLAVVGHVNSNVSMAASSVYAGCGLAMLTAMSSSPGVTDRGLSNVFRLTNRDDHKGPGLAAYLYQKAGKRQAV